MGNEKLFLWEFLISKIKFDTGTSVPDYLNIKIILTCSNILSTEINPGDCPVENPETANFKADNGEYNLQLGKTCLFAAKEDEISNILKSTPLTAELFLSKKSAASASFKWPSEITDIRSAIHTTTLDFIDSGNNKIASMNLSMKLMPLGDNVDAYFSLRNKEATFMNPKTKAKFKCEKTVTIEFPPADFPMTNDSRISWVGIYERKAAPDAISVAQPFYFDDDDLAEKSNKAETASSGGGWDVISIKCRPAENRFMDFLNLMAEETQGRQGSSHSIRKTTFSEKVGVHKYALGELENELTSDKVMRRCCTNPACPAAQKFKEYGLGPLATGPGLGTMYKKVQPTKTYRLSNTYGVFTRYGPFGIFAKSEYPFYPPKEDTTESCPSDFPCLPDEEDQAEVCSCPDTDTSAKTSTCTCGVKYCRLRGGAEKIKNKREKCCCYKQKQQEDKEIPLRLRGGGIADFDDPFKATCELTVWAEYDCSKDLSTDCYGCELYPSRLRGGGKKGKGKKDEEEEKPNAMKSPMEECKSVMDQFNEILQSYKNALGPCGEASCPFSHNICEKYCKTICLATRGDPCPCVETDSCIEIPCNIDECPFKEKPDKKFAGGCGSPKCPYAQYKLGLVTDDAELELAFLPPPILGKCGDPKCDYPPQFLSLPPIHWDCPDPLPQGSCRNPNCPHQPKELLELKVPTPKAPCGSSLCPYAMPPPCDLPSCPFREKPCPFKSQKQSGAANPTCSSEESDDDGDCCNPDCPFSSKGKGKGKGKGKSSSSPSAACCSNPGCPPPGCPPPACPPRGCPSPGCPPPGCPPRGCPPPGCCPSPGCPPPGCPPPGCCPSPGCPPPGCPPPGCCPSPGCPPPGCPPPGCCPKPGCPPPGCPVKMKKPGCCCNQDSDTEESFCDSPECPLNRRKGDPPTCLPKKPPTKSETCPNPECPSRVYARHKKGSEEALICDNNDCPYRKGQGNRDDDEVCGNPNCPYNEPPKKSICANPKCPFASHTAAGDDTDNGSICSSPDCPFGQLRKKKQKGSASVCGNPNCPFKEKPKDKNFDVCDDCQDGACDNPDCPNSKPPPRSSGPDYCDNAMCPFSKEYQTSICVDPFCPYAQPLPSCGIPNCPYEKKPIMFCPSPICPSKFLGPATYQAEETRNSVSGDKKPQGKRSSTEKEPRKSTRRNSSEEKKKNVDGGGDTPAERPSTPAAITRGTVTKDRKSPYTYELGDKWPGVKIGHKECNPPRFRIPQKMGWMWKLQQPYYSCKFRRGWRPGCIEKAVAAMISAHREAKGLGLLKLPDFGTGGKKKRGGTDSDDESLHIKPKPTLHITKKDGVYNILMNPLKDPFSLAENEDPYMDCTPMQFKITKNKLKGGDGDLCMCGGDGEDDSDDSELDIEFTPPAAIIHPDRFKKKKNVVHVESQYNPADFEQKKPKGKPKKAMPKKGKGNESKGKGKKSKKGKSKWKDPGYC